MKNSFKLKVDDGIAVITFDHPTEKVNMLTPAVMKQLSGILTRLEDMADDVDGAIFISGKDRNFIAGATI